MENITISDSSQKEFRNNSAGWMSFLIDVLICSLGAYGGPEAHISVFLDQLVTKRKYLKEEELIELIALCSILPGPTSTQTIVAVGYKTGGPVLAFLTMLVWALPVLTIMSVLSFLYQYLSFRHIPHDVLRYIGPMAVGFIIVAAFRIGKKVIKDVPSALMMFIAAVITYFVRTPWIFPILLVSGGIVSILLSKNDDLWNKVAISPPWPYFAVFALFALGGILLISISDNRLIHLIESFYRYGYLVFGGGQVVVPIMHTELVQVREFMTNQEFLTGYGLVQGLPGPMFSFAAYAGGMAARGGSVLLQIAGAAAGGIGIFLPGLLLIYFVYPVWEDLKKIKGIKVSLTGINAVAAGMIAVAAVTLTQSSGLSLENLAVTAASALMLVSRKIPAPLIVIMAVVSGFVF